MNRPALDPLDDDEARLRDLVAEAGDPTVAARPEYLADLRRTVLDRLGPPRRSRRTIPWLIGSGLATAAVAAGLAVAFVLLRPTNAWAQVARAIREQSWVHGRRIGPDGKTEWETWFSPRTGVMACRGDQRIEFGDPARRTIARYMPTEGTIYLIPEWSAYKEASLDFFRTLLDPAGSARSPLPGTEVIGQTRRGVKDEGRSWEDVELILKDIDGPDQDRARFRLDPRTGLPHSLTMINRDGDIRTTVYDYPDRGPADIYEVGAPREAKVVDRMPGADLKAILAGLKAGRVDFDDYQGVMDYGDGMTLRAMWRKGGKWRVESLHRNAGSPQSAPRDADGAWWTKSLSSYTRVVEAIGDGKQVYYYHLKGELDKGGKQPPRVRLSMTTDYDVPDDVFIPWSDLFPEQLSHPNVSLPSEERVFLVEPKPADGPPGTIRLRVRDTRLRDPASPDLYSLSIDPARKHVALKVETGVFQPTSTPKIGYVETQTMEDLAQAPGGQWYPKRVRSSKTGSNVEVTWTYYLDFRSPIPDDLFRPLK